MQDVDAIEALYAMGHWLMSAERHRDAASVFQLMAHVAPTDERSWLALGACHERLGQPNIAAEMWRVAIAVAARPVRCGIALGRMLREAGRDDEADHAFELAHGHALQGDDPELVALAVSERSEP